MMEYKRFVGGLTVMLLGAALFSRMARAEEPAPAPADIVLGIQMWGQNCARCHNAPPPGAFGDEDWKIITHHMKVRANLTDPEIKAILAYLQTAN